MDPFASEASSSFPSPSSTKGSWTYHVFLSFRGEDTRKGFIDHLFASLERKGITTFKDDKILEKGEVISCELLKAIEESMFAIIVLSPNYASSAWCLDELQKIVECNRRKGLFAVPVFYGVEPSDVRHQKGSFKEAFKKHQKRFKHDKKKITRWKYALTQVADLSGWATKNEHEATLVESIAQDIHKKLIRKLPYGTENLVGILSKLEGMYGLLGMGLKGVRFIGIWGMGGIGKTTIARAVYEAIQDEFKVSCFLANIRETCEAKGVVKIQKELAAHMKVSTLNFSNVYDGKKIIQNSLCNKKVLLVLDDVSEVSQLENLAGKQDWFGSGSRILITTRDKHLLKIHGVHGSYEVKGLIQNEALQLFCLKAFKQDQPKEGFLDLSKEVIKYSGGLPLALEVLGSYLYERSVDVWCSAIKKIKSTLDIKILDTLKISYEALDHMEKNIFLDIACFFKGKKRGYVTNILEMCGYHARIGIDVLIERSLVTQRDDKLEMHDLVEEMGKTIVIQESPNNPGKRSRLWLEEDIDLVLKENKGTGAIQGIVAITLRGNKEKWSMKSFSNMSNLKFLRLHGTELLPLDVNNLSSSLKVFHWSYYPFETFPLPNRQYEVVENKLQDSEAEQLWHGKKVLENLKYLDLSYSWKLKQTPNLLAVPVLETLILASCSILTEVHPSLAHHKNLVVLNLSNCHELETLPSKLEMRCLKELILDNCPSLENLPEFGECMRHLSVLSLERTPIRELPTSLGCLVGLEHLYLNYCKSLVRLPDTIRRLKSLKNLRANGCSNLFRRPMVLGGIEFRYPPIVSRLPLSRLDLSYCHLTETSFPCDLCHFPSLIDLILDANDFVSIPISPHELPKLRRLSLNNCQRLQFLPELPSSMRELEAMNCHSLSTIKFNPISKACNVFASPSKDHVQILRMLISGSEIPSWFVHQEKGNSVSIPLLHNNCPLNDRMGIALCFLLDNYKFHGPSESDNELSNSKVMPSSSKEPSSPFSDKFLSDEFPGQLSDGGTPEFLSDELSKDETSKFYLSDEEFDFPSGLDKSYQRLLTVRSHNRIITDSTLPRMEGGCHLCILCLTDDYRSEESHQENYFFVDHSYAFTIFSSAARWVSKHDIEDLSKKVT